MVQPALSRAEIRLGPLDQVKEAEPMGRKG